VTYWLKIIVLYKNFATLKTRMVKKFDDKFRYFYTTYDTRVMNRKTGTNAIVSKSLIAGLYKIDAIFSYIYCKKYIIFKNKVN